MYIHIHIYIHIFIFTFSLFLFSSLLAFHSHTQPASLQKGRSGPRGSDRIRARLEYLRSLTAAIKQVAAHANPCPAPTLQPSAACLPVCACVREPYRERVRAHTHTRIAHELAICICITCRCATVRGSLVCLQ